LGFTNLQIYIRPCISCQIDIILSQISEIFNSNTMNNNDEYDTVNTLANIYTNSLDNNQYDAANTIRDAISSYVSNTMYAEQNSQTESPST